MCSQFAAYLAGKRWHEEASLLYERAGELDQAASQAEAGLHWQRAGWLARAAGWDPARTTDLHRGLAGRLEQAGRAGEAATVWRERLQDTEEAVAALVRAGSWCEAGRLAREADRPDLLETHARPALRDRRAALATGITARSTRLAAAVARLGQVRGEREASKEAGEEGGPDLLAEVEKCDLFSDAASTATGASTARTRSTLQTRNTTRSKSSKNRRKADRKVFSTKEGSLYEDIGLMAELHELISGLEPLRQEVRLIRLRTTETADNILLFVGQFPDAGPG